MRWVRFDSVGGASGDMILAALIDLGADPGRIRERLGAWAPESFELDVVPVRDAGLRGTRVRVQVQDHGAQSPVCGDCGEAEPHEHGHPHGDAHGHPHSHPHAHPHGSDHVHAHGPVRGLTEIRRLLEASGLPDPVCRNALGVFEAIGEAESRVHGIPIEQIHFHEVGAMDSIIDIAGACLALHELGAEGAVVGPLPLGRGTMRCAHGVYPIPVPATVELLKGFPVVQTDEPFELVTPTGAALLTRWHRPECERAGGRIVRTGLGFGHRALHGRPNVLRATLMESSSDDSPDEVLLLECNLDDESPEIVGLLAGKLLEAGALDAYSTPVFMKKQRPGTLLSALCRPADGERLLDLIFAESSTFGVRMAPMRRATLDRTVVEAATEYGPVRIKLGRWKGRVVTRSPEFEDCRAAAERAGVPVRTVFAAARAAGERWPE